MAHNFEEVVSRVALRIGQGHVILSERVRGGRRRQISVGPYRTAMSTKRQYALCVLPAPSGEDDCKFYPGANRAAREFVRFVGVDEAKDALSRESRKHGGTAPSASKTKRELDDDIAEVLAKPYPP